MKAQISFPNAKGHITKLAERAILQRKGLIPVRLFGEGLERSQPSSGAIFGKICHNSLAVLFLHDLHSKDCFLRFAIATMPQL